MRNANYLAAGAMLALLYADRLGAALVLFLWIAVANLVAGEIGK